MTPTDSQAAVLACADPRLGAALEYVLATPGKQLRARLVRASHQLLSEDPCDGVESVATAIEWLHSYSLVHDDLPAMDDDALRRGKPTVHTVYDDATAILVGDGLQAAAFALITRARLVPGYPDQTIGVDLQRCGFWRHGRRPGPGYGGRGRRHIP